MLGLTLTALATAAMLNGATCAPTDMGFYTLNTVAVDVNEETNTAVCVDFNGNEWSFEGIEDYNNGDYITMLMCDNGTPIIYDDVICATHYDGWLCGDFGYCDGYSVVSSDWD